MMRLALTVCCCLPLVTLANFNDGQATGFHWYTQEQVHHHKQGQSTQSPALAQETVSQVTLSPYQQMRLLTLKTRNALSEAILNPTIENTARYMRAQQFWAKQDQRFVRSWQQALLKYPSLDYSLNFPTDNNAIPVRNDEHKLLVDKTINEMSSHFGLIFFYRGHSSICQKFASVLLPFVKSHHFSMISVTTDHQPIVGLPNPREVPISAIQKVMDLQPRYLPALFLVNLKTKQMQALSYGFISTGDLSERFLDVLNNFKRYSYQGIGEVTK